MQEIKRLIPELYPQRLRKNIVRFWKIYLNPPKERAVYLHPECLPTITNKVSEARTASQPKQVVVDPQTKLAFVSCMAGRKLEIFNLQENQLALADEVEFDDQCVEVLAHRGRVFVTTTNFDRPPREIRNKLWILDASTRKIISSTDTGGNWSKLIAARPQGDELLISNWHSHNISVVDISDIDKPKIKQVLSWGEAPRGIAFLPNGKTAIETGFYSGNLGMLSRNKNGSWKTTYTGKPFDQPRYPGNMRHVLITPDGQNALVSNLGRNLVHIWDIDQRSFIKSISVGKSPNSIDFIPNTSLLAISCRDSQLVYFLDLKTVEVSGISQQIGSEPTGLCGLEKAFLVTCFKENTLELHRVKI